MALTTKNWTLNSYTVTTWTSVVSEPATLTTIIIANNSASVVSVSIRIEDTSVSKSIILPLTGVNPLDSYTIDMRSLNITGTQTLQIYCTAAGAEFTVSGAV